MTGAGAVLALVLFEWSVGWVAAAAWTQSWSVVRRGHFRITAWTGVFLAAAALLSLRSVVPDDSTPLMIGLGFTIGTIAYLLVQYSRTDVPGVVVGAGCTLIGLMALVALATLMDAWSFFAAGAGLVSGALLLGAVSNGMLLGHWYLNQPGLKLWALARLTTLALVAAGVSAAWGLIAAAKLSGAITEGAVLGLPGFGQDFGKVFYATWGLFVLFTAAVVWGARRCIGIRSIQSATGLYYVALLTAGIAEFLVRYLMVNA